ncbi:MAG: phenylalanine--tRNA ligase subunit beta, partial [Rickettsiales bacterium]|nr:phenylalanine--tRNA ligase subunit beta [Rickettsiales bacterium]
MKFTLSWLKDHLDTSASLDTISKALTAAGLEVESISDRTKDLAPFTVAKILHAEKHPEADKLRVCRVMSDVGELQIVCGAPNAREGIHVVLAKEGAVIPGNGMVIKKSKIRGVESNGMLCSADELAISGDSAGIIELPLTTEVGQSVSKVLGLDDPVIEIAITPNRADCLGVRGVARDLAAVGIGALKPLKAASYTGGAPCPVTVSISDANCHQFVGAHITGVKNGASPEWMVQRLAAIGQRSISALVDITNYITFDLGRPLHVYDAKKLRGNLTVRECQAGEKLKALNGVEYTLPQGLCVIADDAGAQALGGVIGGEPTGCDEHTTEVFLEVALFEPSAVAKAGRSLQIDSDARYRFERGVDVAFLEEGAKQSLSLISQLCGGTASALAVAGQPPVWKREIDLRANRIQTLGGVSLDAAKVQHILTALGFTCTAMADGWRVSPPSWRGDVESEADLVEEVLRIHGYDHIPATPLPKLPHTSKPALNLAQKRVHLAKRLLAGRGMLEVCSWSFLPESHAKAFGGGDAKLKLINPINAELDTMRPSLVPNLLVAAKNNAFRGFKTNNLFEVGLQFTGITPEGQRMAATGVRTGNFAESAYKDGLYTQNQRKVDAFDAKADALAVLSSLGLAKCDIQAGAPGWYHPGRSGQLVLGKTVLGYFGELHPALLGTFDLDMPVVAFELFLDALPVPRA